MTAKRSQTIAGGDGGERSDPPSPPVRTQIRISTAERSHPTAKSCALQSNRDDPGVLDRSDGATAPRSARQGGRFRGSRRGSLHSPARDPRLLYRPLRGRGLACARPTAAVKHGRALTPDSARFIPRGTPQACGELLHRPLRGRGLAGARPTAISPGSGSV